jgi:hypothetical protein
MVEETELEVTVMKLRLHLVKVTAGDRGYQLVLGGRLLLDALDGRHEPHPELPEYSPNMFPVPLDRWYEDGNGASVAIVGKRGREHQVGAVRASTLLFTAFPPDVAGRWLKEVAK